MALNKLSPRKVASASPGKHEDGGGLRLVVSKSGGKKWVVRLTLHQKRREFGLGSFPDISLAEARAKAVQYRKLADEGKNPSEYFKKLAAQENLSTPTFTSCAARYIQAHRRTWKSAKHRYQWLATIKGLAKPVIGHKPVDEIDTDDVLQILKPIWMTKNETAKRLQGRIENILDYAAAHNFRDPVNPARWRGHLDKLLPKPSRVQKVRHHPAMPYDDISDFWLELSNKDCTTSRALKFLILTATRASEVYFATWDEIDFPTSSWLIPGERMKAGREHRVPLSRQALEVLNSSPRILGTPYIFPGAREGRPLSNMAMVTMMRKMGFGSGGARGDYVPHGFRSSFRDWAGEVSSYPSDVAEMALAHTIKNKVEAAYRRGDLFEKRANMMQDWADFVVSTP